MFDQGAAICGAVGIGGVLLVLIVGLILGFIYDITETKDTEGGA